MRLTVRLALADLCADALMVLCTVLLIAATLAPLLVLSGLKDGAVNQLLAGLRAAPENRELALSGYTHFDAAWFAAMRARPEVGFLAPRLFELSQQVEVAGAAGETAPTDAVLVVSGAGDPILGDQASLVSASQAVLSTALARRLGAHVNDTIAVQTRRRLLNGPLRLLRAHVRIAAIADPAAEETPAIFVAETLARSLEDFQVRGTAAPAPPLFHSFRLYARDITDVAGLQAELMAQGIEVSSNAGAIARVVSLESTMSALFHVMGACAASGVSIALALALWANVNRKRHALSLLRLLGVPIRALLVFPVAQAVVIAVSGTALAILVAGSIQSVINATYHAHSYLDMRVLCEIGLFTRLATACGSLVIGFGAGAVAIVPVLLIDPAEGFREA
jgi:putative ABC transport system permease protein